MSISPDKLRALKREAGAVDSFSRLREKVAEGRMRARDTAPPMEACSARPHPNPVSALAFGHAQTGDSQAHPLSPQAGDAAKTSIESLRRLLGVRARLPAACTPPGPVDRTLPGEEIATGLRLITTHVACAVPDAALPLAFARRDDSVDPRDLLFFDTETTGLAGGTGTRAFMIGAADWHRDPHHGDGLRIRQLLITTLAAEPAMLRAFAGWLAPHTVLSSYNGRCYDSPLLKTRYRLARMGDPITPLDHVDLLFPTRRRYRGVWENCRLATIERELLKIVREDDLPGSEAPAAWLSYLRGGAATNLRRVAAHNHQDVVTLARLMTRLVAAQAGDAATGGVG